MFIQFSVENYRSFKDTVTFSMLAHPPIKEHENETHSHVFYDPSKKIKLLKSSAIYGANGSGKSNLIAAMSFFKKFIVTSFTEQQVDAPIEVIPFALSAETLTQTSNFEMVFCIDNTRYRYGFKANAQKVQTEWLFALKNDSAAKETKLFTRNLQSFSINTKQFKEAKGIADRTRPNVLFLSTIAQFNGAIATQIVQWFKHDLGIIFQLDDSILFYTIEKLKNDATFKTKVMQFFSAIQIGFDDIVVTDREPTMDNYLKNILSVPSLINEQLQVDVSKIMQVAENTKAVRITTKHAIHDAMGEIVEYKDLPFEWQSRGTEKLFGLLGPIIDAIENGRTLVVDEFDSRLHTLLTIELIQFFHTKGNKKAQLIVASHDTNLLRKELFRRDQIWFAEKKPTHATDLYSLVEYKIDQAKIRNDASFEKDYLAGKYGAIPFLGNIQQFKKDFLDEQN
ncbi:MAG: ATP-binding protein [Chitinophagales bacterium]|nr:ATP-binding protein [Chitinophagales bacterium]